MKIGIMQPYFLPYVGYYQLINHVDLFVLFDDVQFIRKGWINRNRIVNADGGSSYINVPIQKCSLSTKIRDVRVKPGESWKTKILSQCETSYRKKAPHYWKVSKLLSDGLNNDDFINIVELNKRLLEISCKYIGIDTKIIISSEQGFDYSSIVNSGDWALEISNQLGAKEYINPISGREIFDKSKFQNANIDLRFIRSKPYNYEQHDTFVPDLSILDLMMFNGEEELVRLVENYEVLA